jgi:AcrR family transcriptional regulator
MDAALERLESAGFESLSIRELAIATGVSPRAPYRHFSSRGALLLALAQTGQARFEAAYIDALNHDASPLARLERLCRAYLELAHEHPQMYRLIFVSDLAKDPEHGPAWRETVERAYLVFEELVRQLLPHATQAEIEEAGVGIWSVIHGLAMLRMHNRFDRFTALGHEEQGLIDGTLARYGLAEPPPTASCARAADIP